MVKTFGPNKFEFYALQAIDTARVDVGQAHVGINERRARTLSSAHCFKSILIERRRLLCCCARQSTTWFNFGKTQTYALMVQALTAVFTALLL